MMMMINGIKLVIHWNLQCDGAFPSTQDLRIVVTGWIMMANGTHGIMLHHSIMEDNREISYCIELTKLISRYLLE